MEPWSGMGIDHATTHAATLADSLHCWLEEKTTWETAMHEYHTNARGWSEKTYHRTSAFAADLRPMTRAALQKCGLSWRIADRTNCCPNRTYLENDHE